MSYEESNQYNQTYEQQNQYQYEDNQGYNDDQDKYAKHQQEDEDPKFSEEQYNQQNQPEEKKVDMNLEDQNDAYKMKQSQDNAESGINRNHPRYASEIQEGLITVSDPILRDGNMGNKYTVYKIKGSDNQGEFGVYRRFSDFHAVRTSLVNRWPGCYIPPIPDKKAIGNTAENVIEERRRFLNVFLNKMRHYEYLWQSEEVQQLIRASDPEIAKNINCLPKPSVAALVENFRQTFSNALQNKGAVDQELVLKIMTFKTFLTNSKTHLMEWKEKGKILSEVYQKYLDALHNSNTELKKTYDQVKFLPTLKVDQQQSKDISDFSFTEELSQQIETFKDKIKLQKLNWVNPYWIIYQEIKLQYRDFEAFLESISKKEEYEKRKANCQQSIKDSENEIAKLSQGKTTIMSIFKKGKPDEQVAAYKEAISSALREIQQIDELIELQHGIIGLIQLEKFRSEKINIFQTIFQMFVGKQSAMSDVSAAFFEDLNNFVHHLHDLKAVE